MGVLALVAAAVLAAQGSAREVVLRDDEGRAMSFDVRADADLAWYAGLLRRAAHGNEIERVTIRIVDWFELAERCGRHAAGCYSRRKGNRGVMVVPAGRTSSIAHTVLHEYGHHVDASRRHGGLDEPNGTPLWWKARGMAQLVAARSVRDRYEVGWDRSISEVFAEDYAYTNLHRRYKIAWLEPPSETVEQAILADLGLAEPPVVTSARPALRPVVIVRAGRLRPNARVMVDFGLLGPNRRIRLDGRLGSAAGARGNVAVTCGDRLHTKALAATAVSLVVPRAGPGQCRAWLTNAGSRSESFRFTVRLTIS